MPAAATAPCALPSAGFTNCQYFAQVPIQTNDSTQPIVGTRMWVDGVESIRPGDSVTYTTTGDIIVVPFVFDGGGASSISLQQQNVEIFCHDDDLDPEESQVTNIVYFDKFEQQAAGQPGQMRSNGMFLLSDVTDLATLGDYCYAGFDLETVTYSWTVVGRDYSSKQTIAQGTIIYAP